MAISYVERECPDCEEVRTFQEFNSFLGFITTCMECGYGWFETEEAEKVIKSKRSK